MSKFHLSILIVILLIVIGLVFYFFGPLGKPKIAENEAVLIINYGAQKRAFAGKVIDNMTIADTLIASAKAGNFDFDYQKGILKRVDGFEQNGKKWNIYLNGTKIEGLLDKILIKARDKIELKLE